MLLNEEQGLIRRTAAEFASEVIAPSAREWERAGRIPEAVLRQMGELGFLGVTIPEAKDIRKSSQWRVRSRRSQAIHCIGRSRPVE